MKAQMEIPQEALDSIRDEVYRMVMESLGGAGVGDEVFSVQEAAMFMGVSRSSVQRIIDRHPDFPVRQLGRKRKIIKSELVEWLKGREYVQVADSCGFNE